MSEFRTRILEFLTLSKFSTRMRGSVGRVEQISDFLTPIDQVSKSVKKCQTYIGVSDTTQKPSESVNAL